MKEIIGFDTLRLKLFLELKGLKALVMGVFKDLVVIKSFEALVLPLLYLFLWISTVYHLLSCFLEQDSKLVYACVHFIG